MKFGVLHFGYDHVRKFHEQVARDGVFSVNLGDYMQTIAARQFLARRGVPADAIVAINRDNLSQYDGEPVTLLMNACFYNWCFPIPPQITPVFTGFQAAEGVIARHAEYFRQHAPIGCRDDATRDTFLRHGVEAYTTGCLTLTLPSRQQAPAGGRPYIVYGAGAGAFPLEALQSLPRDLLEQAVMVFQRVTYTRIPLTPADMEDAELRAAALLREYRETASLVITSLHHAATPCHALGIPVAICRKADDPRFSFIRRYLPYHVSPDFAGLSSGTFTNNDELREHVEAAATRELDRAFTLRKTAVS